MTSEKSLTAWGERIMLLLGGRKLAWLAREADLGARTLSDIIQKTTPAADKAVRIAQALGVSVEFLMTGQQPDSAPPPKVGEPPIEWQPSDARVMEIGQRVAEAGGIVEEATQIAGVIPSEAMRQAMLTLQFRYGVASDDLALLLVAASRPRDDK